MRILIAEDNEKLNELLTSKLRDEGFFVDTCLNGEDACFYGEQDIYDVILLDRMLPSMEGTKVLTYLRRKKIHTPIIFMTALGTLSDRISGLNLGADDYLVKPFAFEELLARIRCVARRPHALVEDGLLRVYDIVYDPSGDKLSGPLGNCTLARREAALLETFLRRKEQTLSRNMLLLKVWGPDSDVEDGNLDNYIHFIRRRLHAIGSRLQIKTIRGIGYCLSFPSSDH